MSVIDFQETHAFFWFVLDAFSLVDISSSCAAEGAVYPR